MSSIKKRKDCFLGVHSDFHAKITDGLVIGATLKEEDIREYLETLRPDFIQIDCKGHPGWASYPTELNNRLPAYNGDPLRLWRDITKEYGVALYMHYSGVFDKKYCTENPEQATINKDGEPSQVIRLDGDYFKDLFIPQISELVEKYEIDGIWIDGDCWAVEIDYREDAINRFEKITGIALNGKPPKSKEDKYYKELLDFTRDEFRDILKWYVDELHKKYPDLQICSNWAFSDHMPGDILANVDFLSGDFMPKNCVNSARYAGRALAQQNMHWDLMSWGHRFGIYDTLLLPHEHISQLMQEGAIVAALGGSYHFIVCQYNDGSLDMARIRTVKPVIDFLREREPYCFGKKAVHQAALLLSTYDREYEMETPFDRIGTDKLMGLTALFCDSGESLEIVSEHTLKNHYSDYPMIIIPELYHGLSNETLNELKEYAENGGSLMIVGTSTCRIFSDNGFGFKVKEYSTPPVLPGGIDHNIGHAKGTARHRMANYFTVSDTNGVGLTKGACEIISNDINSKVYATIVHNIKGENPTPFSVSYPFGKGKICVIGSNIGSQYSEGRQYLFRALIRKASHELYKHIVTVENVLGSLEVVCLEDSEKLYIQLVNVGGGHADPTMVTEESIAPLADIRLTLNLPYMPEKLILQPEGKELSYTYENEKIYLDIPRVDLHSIIEVIY